MKKIFSAIVIAALLPWSCYANCDWTQIKKNSDGTYTYSEQLHLCVGQLVQDNKAKDQQIQDLNKAITLKDLAIKEADARADNWMLTSKNLEDRLQKVDSIEKKNEWVYFGLGILVTGAAVWGANKLAYH